MFSLVLAGLGGCAALPSSGPDANQVVRASQGPTPEFKIIDLVDVPSQDIVGRAPDFGTFDRIAQGIVPAAADRIEVGDTLQITVFEVGAALFNGASGGATSNGGSATGAPVTANAENLPVVPVGPDGDIVLPYIGRVKAAGLTPKEVGRAIEAGLKGKSQSPQVIVTVREDEGNTVILIGDVKTPGRKPLSYRRENLLDMLAIAGGPTNPKPDTLVRVTRDGRTVQLRLGDIQSGSPEDVQLQPQDRIELIYQPRTFTAFGAAGKISEIPFQTQHLSLAEALARMGGPSDQQADPTGVFIFRPRDGLSSVEPTVYRLNLKDPKGFFIAQEFQVQDKDLIFIANSRSNAWYKFLSIINTIANPIVNAKYLGL